MVKVSEFSKGGKLQRAKRDLLPNSSDEERESRRLHISDSDSDGSDDSLWEYNQNDFDLGVSTDKRTRKVQDVEIVELEIESWPPTTYSGSGGVFCVNPTSHAKYDPKFCRSVRNAPINMKKVMETLAHFSSTHGGFEPCFTDEPPANIAYRMDSYQNAWDMCLLRCSKVLSAHFSVALLDVCQYIRSKHDSRFWQLNILPTAVLSLGADSSDHPVFFGVLHSQLKRRYRHVAFLRPRLCTTMPKLMKSLTQQVISDIRPSSEHSFISIQRYAESLEKFALTIVVENVEQWSNSELLDAFITIASQYSSVMNMTLILAVSSTKEAVLNVLSSSVLQHLSIRSFQISASTTAIDLILKNTLLAPDAPFQISSVVLKWLLENVKFLNYSVTSLVTKLKFIYWRFYYTHPMSWVTNTAVESFGVGETSSELMAPMGRIVHKFFSQYPYMEAEEKAKEYLDWFRPAQPEVVSRPSRTCKPVEQKRDPITPSVALRQWKSKYQRLVVFRSLALQLFMLVRHLPVFQHSASTLLDPSTFLSLPEESIKLVDAMKRAENQRLDANGAKQQKNLGQVNGLFDASNMERHDWYGCPHAIEYYSLITNARSTINWAFEPFRNNAVQLRALFDLWLSIIDSEEYSCHHPALNRMLHAIFEGTQAAFEIIDAAREAKISADLKNGSDSTGTSRQQRPTRANGEFDQEKEDQKSMEDVRRAASEFLPSNEPGIAKFLDNLVHRMKDVILGAFEEDASAHTPLSLDLTFSDAAVLNRRFNPNIRPSQTNAVLDMVAELHEVKKTAEQRQAKRTAS